ncbi:MAG: PCP reductase family protein [Longimicrobiales bacterium]
MKFLCLECDDVMSFAERQIPGDGTLAAVFECGSCGREMAMLTNPMETQLVSGMGVKIGGRTVPEQPMEITRTTLAETRDDAFVPTVEEREGGDVRDGADAPDAGETPDSAERPDRRRAAAPTGGARGSPPSPPGASAPRADGGSGRADGAVRVHWTPDAVDRLQRVPRFVRGMVKRIYTDYARERGIEEITPDTMDRARTDLGLEGM